MLKAQENQYKVVSGVAMKTLLTILGVLWMHLFPIIAEDHISSKFTRLTCTIHDKVLIVNESCTIKPISRNETIINLYAYLTHEIDDILIHLQLFKKFNVYKPFLVNVKEEFCKLFTKKSSVPYTKILSRIAAPYTNIHHSCPYIGEVSLKNMILDPNRLRPLWPVGDYRADIEIMANKSPTPSQLMQLASVVCIATFLQHKVHANESNVAKFTSIDCLSVDPEYVSNTSCRVKAARRDSYLINISIMLKKPLDNLVVRIKLFKKGNTFMPFLIDAKENLCEFLLRKHVSMYMKVIGSIYLPYSNVNSSCPLVGEQIFKDMPLDGKLLPSIWPTGEYRLDIFIHRFEKLIIIMRFNFALEEKIRRKPWTNF